MHYIFGIIAGIIQILGYTMYAVEVGKRHIQPNAGSWFIWGYGNIIVCLSYLLGGSVSIVDVLPIVCSICSVIITLWFMRIGTFNKVTPLEKKMIAVDVMLTIVWILLLLMPTSIENPTIAIHLILQVSAIVSFIPIIKEVSSIYATERYMPWVVWTAAYVLFLIAEVLADAPWYKLIYPFVYSILHAIVGALSYRHFIITNAYETTVHCPK